MTACFDIRDCGADPAGTASSTLAIQRAIDAAHAAGGGTVRCEAGTYTTGTLFLKSHVELHLARGCRLVASRDLTDYAPLIAPGFRHEASPEASSQALLAAVDAEHIAVTGPGLIDGSGEAFYEPHAFDARAGKYPKPPTSRPRIIMFYRCRDVQLDDVTLTNAACWTVWLMRCQTVQIHRVKISGDPRLRNIDGIDIDGCRDVTVSDCVIRTEDDCLVVRSMQQLYDDQPVICENVVVTNCVLESRCQGVRIGCPSDGVIRHATFSNLVIHSTSNGIVFDNPARYARNGGSADISDISFSNVTINCDRAPIRVSVEQGITLPRIADLRFANFRIRSGGPCIFTGNTTTTLDNIRLSQIDIQTQGDDAILCRHCRGLMLSDVNLSNRA